MDEVKHRFRDFMKKASNNLTSCSSGKFKGHGRVLGGSNTPPIRSTDQNLNKKPNWNHFNSDARTRTDSDHQKTEKSDGFLEYLSGNPPLESVEVVMKLLTNVVSEPENLKFRKIRLGNPKIRRTVTEIEGGMKVLEFVGFELEEEDGETWAVMVNPPEDERIRLIHSVIEELGSTKMKFKENEDGGHIKGEEQHTETKNQDRQVRVFFSVPGNLEEKLELPDAFYKLSAQEIHQEAEIMKKKVEDSQLLIPKSYKEKKAKATRNKNIRSLIHVQFPDGVLLEAVFSPSDPIMSLFEFVGCSLKDPSAEFELLYNDGGTRWVVIPRSSTTEEDTRTLGNSGMVPSALIKLRPSKPDAFTGLCEELLKIGQELD